MNARLTALLGVLFALAAAPASHAAVRTITIDPGHAAQQWTGAPTAGVNGTWFLDGTGPIKSGQCTTDPYTYCDDTLVRFTSDVPLEDSTLSFRIDGFQHSDYDLRVYASDASGAAGELLGTGKGEGKGLVPVATFAGDPESFSTEADPDSWYLVRVVYFAVPGDENYTGSVSWAGTPSDPGAPAGS